MYVCTTTALTSKLDVVSMAKLLLAIKRSQVSIFDVPPKRKNSNDSSTKLLQWNLRRKGTFETSCFVLRGEVVSTFQKGRKAMIPLQNCYSGTFKERTHLGPAVLSFVEKLSIQWNL